MNSDAGYISSAPFCLLMCLMTKYSVSGWFNPLWINQLLSPEPYTKIQKVNYARANGVSTLVLKSESHSQVETRAYMSNPIGRIVEYFV